MNHEGPASSNHGKRRGTSITSIIHVSGRNLYCRPVKQHPLDPTTYFSKAIGNGTNVFYTQNSTMHLGALCLAGVCRHPWNHRMHYRPLSNVACCCYQLGFITSFMGGCYCLALYLLCIITLCLPVIMNY